MTYEERYKMEVIANDWATGTRAYRKHLLRITYTHDDRHMDSVSMHTDASGNCSVHISVERYCEPEERQRIAQQAAETIRMWQALRNEFSIVAIRIKAGRNSKYYLRFNKETGTWFAETTNIHGQMIELGEA